MSDVLRYFLSELRQWSLDRHADILRREHQYSLNVGLNKPLGGQGFQASFAGLWSMWKMCRAAKKQNTSGSTRFLSGGAVGGTLWIYAYDRHMLEDILLDHSELLSAEGWPCADADAFIQKSREALVAPYTPMYDLIASLYGDKLNPGLTKVLPGVGRLELLEMYYAVHGEPDPAVLYFKAANWPGLEAADTGKELLGL
jgi:hypothetical protein